jgi:hypothetical protein
LISFQNIWRVMPAHRAPVTNRASLAAGQHGGPASAGSGEPGMRFGAEGHQALLGTLAQ